MWRDLMPQTAEGWIGAFLSFFALLTLAQTLILGVLASLEARRESRRQRLPDRLSLFEGDLAPPISILVPARDAASTIVDSVQSLTQLRYPSIEIIVVIDGPGDGTLEALQSAFRLRPSARTARARVPRGRVVGVFSSPHRPELVVVNTASGGKAQALNVGLAFARHPLVCAIDSGSVLERDALLDLALPFYQDAGVAATGGIVRPHQAAKPSRIHGTRFQNLEYLRSALTARMGWNLIDCLYVASNALSLFHRDAVMAVGGYRTSTYGEDMDLAMRIQRWARRHGTRRAVRFVPGAVAWAEMPTRIRAISHQRGRWHQGLAESLWLNRSLAVKPGFSLRHGTVLLSLVLVDLMGPVWELLGLAFLAIQAIAGRVDGGFATIYLGVYVLVPTLYTLLGVALESVVCARGRRNQDALLLVAYALFENLGYRQLLAGWRVWGLWSALRRLGEAETIARLGHPEAETDRRSSSRAEAA